MHELPARSLVRRIGAAFVALLIVSAAAADNLLPNASFEEKKGEAPAAWVSHTFGGNCEFAHLNAGRDGAWAVQIESTKGADAAWRTDIPVKRGGVYRLSGWIRTTNLAPHTGRGALLSVHQLPASTTPALTGTSEWTRVESIVRIG
ncbi:MAG: hypothetical protein HZB38_08945, partial [Planctomycetes bacterium]|nr:hypothetical protein [Planctomycetota bacterium]